MNVRPAPRAVAPAVAAPVSSRAHDLGGTIKGFFTSLFSGLERFSPETIATPSSGTLRSAWEVAKESYSITEQDARLTPDEARQKLASGSISRSSEEWKRLTAAADGFTHLGANKRFDNMRVSEGLVVKEAAIDMVSKASDHQGVIVDWGLGA